MLHTMTDDNYDLMLKVHNVAPFKIVRVRRATPFPSFRRSPANHARRFDYTTNRKPPRTCAPRTRSAPRATARSSTSRPSPACTATSARPTMPPLRRVSLVSPRRSPRSGDLSVFGATPLRLGTLSPDSFGLSCASRLREARYILSCVSSARHHTDDQSLCRHILTRLTQAKELGESIVVNGQSASLPLSLLSSPSSSPPTHSLLHFGRDRPRNPHRRQEGRRQQAGIVPSHPAQPPRHRRGGRPGRPVPLLSFGRLRFRSHA